MDIRPFHNHGDWVGPCSDGRHEAIKNGMNPHLVGIDKNTKEIKDPIAMVFEMLRIAIENTRTTDRALYCACCKFCYVEYP